MRIERRYTKHGRSPYDGIAFRLTTSEIRNPDGSIVFHLENMEVPEHWSQVATDVLAQKYFRKAGVPKKLKSVEEESCWRGFKPGNWCGAIDVRDFIVSNATPYAGDEKFLAGASKRTRSVCTLCGRAGSTHRPTACSASQAASAMTCGQPKARKLAAAMTRPSEAVRTSN